MRASVAHVLGADVKLATEAHRGKAAEQPRRAPQTVVYKMDNYLLRPPVLSGDAFRLDSTLLQPVASDRPGDSEERPLQPEYAA